MSTDVVERVRMAVAEAGYDASAIARPWQEGDAFSFRVGAVPDEVLWRARETALAGRPLCFACMMVGFPYAEERPDCLAERRFVQDCGRERTEP